MTERPEDYKKLLGLVQRFGLDLKTGGVKENMLYLWYSDTVNSAYQDGWNDKAFGFPSIPTDETNGKVGK